MMKHVMLGAALMLAAAGALGAQDTSATSATSTTTTTSTSRRATSTTSDSAVTPVFQLSPYVGWMMFGNYFRRSDDVVFSNQDRPVYGAQATIHLSPYVALVGNFGYSRSRWTFKNYFGPGQDLNLRRVGVWLFDGDLEFRLPHATGSTSSIAPFVQLGAGGIRYTANAGSIDQGNTNFAFNAGLGIDIQASRAIGVRLMAKDYLTSLKWTDVTRVSINDRTSNNVALSLGLNIGF